MQYVVITDHGIYTVPDIDLAERLADVLEGTVAYEVADNQCDQVA